MALIRILLVLFVMAHGDSLAASLRATPEELVEEVALHLQLRDEQQARVRPVLLQHFATTQSILKEYGVDITVARRARLYPNELMALRQELLPLRTATDETMRAILDDAQWQLYERMRDERAARIRAHLR
jgi:hypothetical protein